MCQQPMQGPVIGLDDFRGGRAGEDDERKTQEVEDANANMEDVSQHSQGRGGY